MALQTRNIFITPITFLLSLCLLLPTACEHTSSEKARLFGPIAKNGMVSTAHPLATQVGLDILQEGGNAFDAAIAVQFALAVVYPAAGNIGGGGFLVARKSDGTSMALDFREKAPAAATRDMYLNPEGEVMKGKSRLGHLAAGVPGSVDGMLKMYDSLATMPWKTLVQPAIDLAANGFTLTEREADKLNNIQDELLEANTAVPHLVREQPWAAGDTIYYADLAKTLTRIRDMGRGGFYRGETAELIVKEMEAGGGLITAEDLANYQAKWRAPLYAEFKGHTVISMGPPSSGGVALIQLLKGSEMFDLKAWGHNATNTTHVMVELERRVYADRATHLGDADFYDVPIDMLLSGQYLQKRFANIGLTAKTDSKMVKAGERPVAESLETTHFSIVDKDRNAASITTTINGGFGNKVMVAGAGFFLNNEMDDFSIKPGYPNMFGLIGGEANAIAPGKRMLSSMTPTIVEKDGQLKMVVGTPGGSTIITSVYQTIMNVLVHGMSMQEAVNAKKFHSQWLPDVVMHEDSAFSTNTRKALEAKGHVLKEIGSLGRMDCVLVNPDGSLEGAADHTRADNTAMGY